MGGALRGGIGMEKRFYTVTKIEGEYATLTGEDGSELFIALVLLPQEADIGVRLKWEELTYSVIE